MTELEKLLRKSIVMAFQTGTLEEVKQDIWTNVKRALIPLGGISAFVLVSSYIAMLRDCIAGLTPTGSSFFDYFYFTVMNVTTVGFGDYVPKGTCGELLAIFNALLGMIFMGIVVAIVAASWMPPFGEVTVIKSVKAATGEQRKDDESANDAPKSPSEPSDNLRTNAELEAEFLKTIAKSARLFAEIMEGNASGHEKMAAVKVLRSDEAGGAFQIIISPDLK